MKAKLRERRLLVAWALGTIAACSHAADDAASADAVSKVHSYAAVAGQDVIGGSPAATVLGINSDKVEHPNTVQTIALDIAQGFNPTTGGTGTGFALDFAPLPLFWPSSVVAEEDYTGRQKRTKAADGSYSAPTDLTFSVDELKRIGNRFTVSLATTNATPPSGGASSATSGSANAVKSAWGIRVGLINFGDPGLYYQESRDCADKYIMPSTSPMPVLDDKTPGQGDSATKYKNAEKCLGDVLAKENLWAAFSVYAGLGQSYYLDKASLSGIANATSNAKLIWVNVSKGIPTAGTWRTLIQGYVERRLDDRVPSATNSSVFVRQDTSQAILRLRSGTDKWHAYGEVGASKVQLGDATKENLRHYALGAEFSATFLQVSAPDAKNMNWFQLAVVSERGYSDGKSHNGVLFSYKFGAPFMGVQ